MAERNENPLTGSDRSLGHVDQSGNNDTSAIRAEIAETRGRMSDTLDEIGSRLNPHVVKEQVTQRVKDGIREATIGRVEHMARNAVDKVSETKTTLTDTVRDNPIPAAMVAIGLGWLMLNGRSNTRDGRFRDEYSAADRQAPVYGMRDYERMGAGEEGTMDRARDRVSEVAGDARERVADFADKAKSNVADVTHAARDAAGNVKERAHDLAHNAAETSRRTAVRVEDMYHENPLVLGAATLALGVAAGFAVPRTDREVRFFGDAREEIVDRVKEVAEETKEKVEHVASRAMDEARIAAHEEGLPGA